mmetsp:Transcript_22748/g.42723  ORF Transcript_22748/g.42723 Transcript_22748/m.42723 type:complete len:169 (-) Transcript_22748:53-559(-)
MHRDMLLPLPYESCFGKVWDDPRRVFNRNQDRILRRAACQLCSAILVEMLLRRHLRSIRSTVLLCGNVLHRPHRRGGRVLHLGELLHYLPRTQQKTITSTTRSTGSSTKNGMTRTSPSTRQTKPPQRRAQKPSPKKYLYPFVRKKTSEVIHYESRSAYYTIKERSDAM